MSFAARPVVKNGAKLANNLDLPFVAAEKTVVDGVVRAAVVTAQAVSATALPAGRVRLRVEGDVV